MVKAGDKLPEATLNQLTVEYTRVIKAFNLEKPGQFEVSSAEKMLEQL